MSYKKGASVSTMNTETPDNDNPRGDNPEETSMNLEAVKDNLEEISKKAQNVEKQLSEVLKTSEKMKDDVHAIYGEIKGTKKMFEELSNNQHQKNNFWDRFLKKLSRILVKTKGTVQEAPTFISPEDIYDEFRKQYSKCFTAPCFFILLGDFLIFLLLIFVFKFNIEQNNLTYWPLLLKNILIMLIPAICFVFFFVRIRDDKKTDKKDIIIIVFILWFLTIVMMLFNRMPRKIVLLLDLFFLLLFMISHIDYESVSYTEDDKDRAKQLLIKILQKERLDSENPYLYDLLVNYSAYIEDSLVLVIRKFKNWANGLFIGVLFSANIDVIKGLFKSIDDATLEPSIEVVFYQILIVDFLFAIALLFAGYKYLNWKSNLYKTILKEIQFTFVIKKELK